jgi:hypothetical protein
MTFHGQSLTDITRSLGRSKAWVSMWRGLLAELTPAIEAILFRGAFPVYSYLYTLRPLRRMNGVVKRRVESFIQALAGHKLSVREIESLARCYFSGPDSMRRAISQRMGVSRGTVKAVIERQGQMPTIAWKDRIHIDPDLLRRLYEECGGWKQRIHERLVEEKRSRSAIPR